MTGVDCWLLHGTELFEKLGFSQLDLFIVWNLKIHYLVHKSPSFVRMLSQINPVYALPSYCFRLNKYLTTFSAAVHAFRLIKHLTAMVTFNL
jgi:hypothetical protein